MLKSKKLIIGLVFICILAIVVGNRIFTKNNSANSPAETSVSASLPETSTEDIPQLSELIDPPASNPPEEATKALELLNNQLPYNPEKLKAITISYKDAEPIIVPERERTLINQSLYLLNFDLAKVEAAITASDPVMLEIQADGEKYMLEYELNVNAFRINEQLYYADYQVAEYMHRLFKPDSKLALIDKYVSLAIEEHIASEYQYDDSFRYEFSKFDIDGKDYNGWMDVFSKQANLEVITKYYNYYSDTLEQISYDKDLDILISSHIYFLSDQVETIDGIKVGMTKEEVIEKLGVPNSQLSTEWSYFVGDYMKFRLYFEDNQVIFMKLIAPH